MMRLFFYDVLPTLVSLRAQILSEAIPLTSVNYQGRRGLLRLGLGLAMTGLLVTLRKTYWCVGVLELNL